MFNRLKRFTKRAYDRAKNYQKDAEGATAIEFSILALPFFTLIFGILELAIVLFISSTLTHAVGEAGRQIRIGNFQACGGDTAEGFRSLVCKNMAAFGSCGERLQVFVQTGSDFSSINMQNPAQPADKDEKITAGSVDSTSGGDPVVVLARYYYPLVLPPLMTRLETRKGTGIREIDAPTAFRNEPFSTPGTCPA